MTNHKFAPQGGEGGFSGVQSEKLSKVEKLSSFHYKLYDAEQGKETRCYPLNSEDTSVTCEI